MITLISDNYPKNENQEISLNNWRNHPYNRVAFSNIEEILPVSIIKKGKNSISFRYKSQDLSSFTFLNKYKENQSVIDFLERNYVDMFLVIKRGNIVFEWFFKSKFKNKQHILFSVSKSITALVTALLIENKLIDENKNLTFYIPEIKNSAYEGGTIRNLLDMSISSDFKEEYLDNSGLFNLYREATGFNPRSSKTKIGLKEFLKLMPKSERLHGSKYQYCSPNTDLLGWIIERITNKKFSEFFSREIYQKCNPNYDAFVTLDHENSPRTAGGICMSVEDLGKIAELVRCKGALENQQIIKENTISNLIDYDNQFNWLSIEQGNLFPEGSYRSQWYQTGLPNKEIYASGIHGQKVWIDRKNEISIVALSSRKQPLSPSFERNFSIFCSEICKNI